MAESALTNPPWLTGDMRENEDAHANSISASHLSHTLEPADPRSTTDPVNAAPSAANAGLPPLSGRSATSSPAVVSPSLSSRRVHQLPLQPLLPEAESGSGVFGDPALRTSGASSGTPPSVTVVSNDSIIFTFAKSGTLSPEAPLAALRPLSSSSAGSGGASPPLSSLPPRSMEQQLATLKERRRQRSLAASDNSSSANVADAEGGALSSGFTPPPTPPTHPNGSGSGSFGRLPHRPSNGSVGSGRATASGHGSFTQIGAASTNSAESATSEGETVTRRSADQSSSNTGGAGVALSGRRAVAASSSATPSPSKQIAAASSSAAGAAAPSSGARHGVGGGGGGGGGSLAKIISHLQESAPWDVQSKAIAVLRDRLLLIGGSDPRTSTSAAAAAAGGRGGGGGGGEGPSNLHQRFIEDLRGGDSGANLMPSLVNGLLGICDNSRSSLAKSALDTVGLVCSKFGSRRTAHLSAPIVIDPFAEAIAAKLVAKGGGTSKFLVDACVFSLRELISSISTPRAFSAVFSLAVPATSLPKIDKCRALVGEALAYCFECATPASFTSTSGASHSGAAATAPGLGGGSGAMSPSRAGPAGLSLAECASLPLVIAKTVVAVDALVHDPFADARDAGRRVAQACLQLARDAADFTPAEGATPPPLPAGFAMERVIRANCEALRNLPKVLHCFGCSADAGSPGKGAMATPSPARGDAASEDGKGTRAGVGGDVAKRLDVGDDSNESSDDKSRRSMSPPRNRRGTVAPADTGDAKAAKGDRRGRGRGSVDGRPVRRPSRETEGATAEAAARGRGGESRQRASTNAPQPAAGPAAAAAGAPSAIVGTAPATKKTRNAARTPPPPRSAGGGGAAAAGRVPSPPLRPPPQKSGSPSTARAPREALATDAVTDRGGNAAPAPAAAAVTGASVRQRMLERGHPPAAPQVGPGTPPPPPQGQGQEARPPPLSPPPSRGSAAGDGGENGIRGAATVPPLPPPPPPPPSAPDAAERPFSNGSFGLVSPRAKLTPRVFATTLGKEMQQHGAFTLPLFAAQEGNYQERHEGVAKIWKLCEEQLLARRRAELGAAISDGAKDGTQATSTLLGSSLRAGLVEEPTGLALCDVAALRCADTNTQVQLAALDCVPVLLKVVPRTCVDATAPKFVSCLTTSLSSSYEEVFRKARVAMQAVVRNCSVSEANSLMYTVATTAASVRNESARIVLTELMTDLVRRQRELHWQGRRGDGVGAGDVRGGDDGVGGEEGEGERNGNSSRSGGGGGADAPPPHSRHHPLRKLDERFVFEMSLKLLRDGREGVVRKAEELLLAIRDNLMTERQVLDHPDLEREQWAAIARLFEANPSAASPV